MNWRRFFVPTGEIFPHLTWQTAAEAENRQFYCRSVAKLMGWRYNFPEVKRMQTIDKQQFGAFVARLRKEQGWTQKELAERLCISDKAVSKWETGDSLR